MVSEDFPALETLDELIHYFLNIAEEYSKAGLISLAIQDNLLWHWHKNFKVIIPLLKRLNLEGDFLVQDEDLFNHAKSTKKIEKIFLLEAVYQMGKIIFTHRNENKDTYVYPIVDRLMFYRLQTFYKPIIDHPVDTIKLHQPKIEIDKSEKFIRYKVKEFFIHMAAPENEEEYNLIIHTILNLIKSIKIHEDSPMVNECKELISLLTHIFETPKSNDKSETKQKSLERKD